MNHYLKFADLVLAVTKLATILIVAAMTITVLIAVFFRFVIPLPIAWPPEAARFMMVAVTMIAGSIAARHLEHVGITLVVDLLPRPVALGLYIIGNVLVCVFLVVFIWFSARLTLEMGPRQISPSLGLSMVYAYASMPIGGVLMLIQTVAATIEGTRRAAAGDSPFSTEASSI